MDRLKDKDTDPNAQKKGEGDGQFLLARRLFFPAARRLVNPDGEKTVLDAFERILD